MRCERVCRDRREEGDARNMFIGKEPGAGDGAAGRPPSGRSQAGSGAPMSLQQNGHRLRCRRRCASRGGFHRRQCLALSAGLWDWPSSEGCRCRFGTRKGEEGAELRTLMLHPPIPGCLAPLPGQAGVTNIDRQTGICWPNIGEFSFAICLINRGYPSA